MSSALATQQPTASEITWSNPQKKLIKEVIAKNCDDNELKLFAYHCHRTGLDPFSRQIYAIKRGGKLTIQTSIDGLRAIAERTGELAGSQRFWCGPDGEWREVWLESAPPAASKVVVHRKGCDHPFVGVAVFKDYSTGENLWKKMPSVMIGKCAEAQALRAGFPADLSGLYTSEEMDQANVTDVSAQQAQMAAAGGGEIVEPEVVEPEVLEPAAKPAPAPRRRAAAAAPAEAPAEDPASPAAAAAPAPAPAAAKPAPAAAAPAKPAPAPAAAVSFSALEELAEILGGLNATGRKALFIAYAAVPGFQAVTSIDEFLEVAGHSPASHIKGLPPATVESLNQGLHPVNGKRLTAIVEETVRASVDVDGQEADGSDPVHPFGED